MDLPRYDLHCHSTMSDGSLSPEDLVQRAEARGLEVLALTDHDTIEGVYKLQELRSDLHFISGAEFTCAWNRRILHIVGLGFDSEAAELRQYFARLSELRKSRAEKIAAQLIKMGLPDLLEDAAAQSGGGSIGRPHFARAMVARKVVSNEQQAFKKYLGVGKKGDVKMEWPSLEEAVSVIRSASGIAVLAHPTKYKMTFTKIREAIADFVAVGGEGIEISYPGVTPDHQFHLIRIAKDNGLLISAGSDFHSPGQGWTDIGKYPPLKSEENHILSRLLN
ncbi:PHP domain-containing protein [Neptuniibacter sp.]|uniref:PHP domain-containing protein n=1 Tax=Neptuniibacter sp. TaxID=1962643 RepID=UPI0026310BA5|nr:PHP domain-containing protein [Neptuniibacter sp.]MCP4594970.1 PHP domain-containing protein [Neptuniibacter sp.]